MPRTEETSARIASIAARGIREPRSLSPDEIKAVCASALTQKPKGLLARLKEKVMP